MRALLAAADLRLLASARRVVLKDERDAIVEVLGAGADAVVVKTYRNRGLRLLQTFARRARAAREHDNLAAAASSGVPCTPPLGWSEARRLGCVQMSTLVTRFVDDCRSLKQTLPRLAADGDWQRRRDLARALGHLLARLHAGGVLWCTPMPRNVLVAAGTPPRLLVCDLPAAMFWPAAVPAGAAALDLYDALMSPSRRRDWSRAERYCALLAYSGGDRAVARSWWRQLGGRPRWLHRLRKNLWMALRTYILRRRPQVTPGSAPR